MAKKLNFKDLSNAQKRVAIAKDVLKQIETKKFLLQRGTWGGVGELITLDQTVLTTAKRPVCTACALGAAVLSSIRLYNDCQISGGEITGMVQDDQLGKFFSKLQRRLIEIAFEKGCGAYSPAEDYGQEDLEHDATAFGESFVKDVTRAKAIFRNIVKNKGTFVP